MTGIRESQRVLEVAAHAYRYASELDDPVLDSNVRRLYRDRLTDAVRRLTPEEAHILADLSDMLS